MGSGLFHLAVSKASEYFNDPLYGNYQPHTKKGMESKVFNWSVVDLLMVLLEE